MNNPNLLSPLTLAFVGDAVYDLLARQYLISLAERPSGQLHDLKVDIVNANAQSKAMDLIIDSLSDDELMVYKRGRNAKSNNTPKNSSVAEYHAATGLEALFGYLYLDKKYDRMNELFDLIMKGE